MVDIMDEYLKINLLFLSFVLAFKLHLEKGSLVYRGL